MSNARSLGASAPVFEVRSCVECEWAGGRFAFGVPEQQLEFLFGAGAHFREQPGFYF
jgi:hypothetical protein